MTAPALIRKADVARMVEQRAAGWYVRSVPALLRHRAWGQRTLIREGGQSAAVIRSGRRWPYFPSVKAHARQASP